MALWIKTRPDEQADPAELAVAKRLADLPDDWLVVWGFYFAKNKGDSLDHEGDFLVQDPLGHVLVIEVKRGRFRRFVATGEWEIEGRTDPRVQLNAECASVIESLRAASKKQGGTGSVIPRVSKALALPSAGSLHDYDSPTHDWRSTLILTDAELNRIEHIWENRIRDSAFAIDRQVARTLFLTAFGSGATPKALRMFSDVTDHLLLRHTGAEFGLLDHLAENSRFVFSGGPGTGKTFFAIECARRFAEQGNGRRVFMPVFNLPLCHQLRRVFAKYPPRRGSITVATQGETAQRIFSRTGLSTAFPTPSTPGADRTTFYGETLPRLLAEALAKPGILREFDALVVDEAQDHETALPGIEGGWWRIYKTLLDNPDEAPVALCQDPGQRALFRTHGLYEPEKLPQLFPGLVKVRLNRCVRYTESIYRYLRKISGADQVRPPDELLPAGLQVDDESHFAGDMPKAIEKVLRKWWAAGVITGTDQVLLISPRGSLSKTSLAGVPAITGAPLVEFDETTDGQPGTLRHLNIHRAKGLDERAVIVFDLLPPEASQDAALTRQNHLLGASRARQALAVLWLKPETVCVT